MIVGFRSSSSPSVLTRASFTWPSVGCCRGAPSVPYGRVPGSHTSPYGVSESAYPHVMRQPKRASISRWRSRLGAGPV